MRIPDHPAPIHQTDFSPGRGNALQACIAALFHLPLEDVPNFVTLPEGYAKAIDSFCRAHVGYKSTKVAVPAGTPTIRPFDGEISNANNDGTQRWCLLRGTSPRGDFGHVVIAKAYLGEDDSLLYFDLVWDPHPDGSFLDVERPYGWYMLFDRIDDTKE